MLDGSPKGVLVLDEAGMLPPVDGCTACAVLVPSPLDSVDAGRDHNKEAECSSDLNTIAAMSLTKGVDLANEVECVVTTEAVTVVVVAVRVAGVLPDDDIASMHRLSSKS